MCWTERGQQVPREQTACALVRLTGCCAQDSQGTSDEGLCVCAEGPARRWPSANGEARFARRPAACNHGAAGTVESQRLKQHLQSGFWGSGWSQCARVCACACACVRVCVCTPPCVCGSADLPFSTKESRKHYLWPPQQWPGWLFLHFSHPCLMNMANVIGFEKLGQTLEHLTIPQGITAAS